MEDLESAIQELRDYKEQDFTGCYSVDEISIKLNETKKGVRDIIKDCMLNGTCEYVGKKHGTGIDGRVTKTPMYRFTFKNKNGIKNGTKK